MSKHAKPLLILTLLIPLLIMPLTPVSAATPDSWTSKASMNEARSGLGVAVVNGKIYAIGGASEGRITGTNEEYDPATNTWMLKAQMPTPRIYFATAVYQNKIYCVGGIIGDSPQTGSVLTSVNEVYDPATDVWETKASLPTASALPAAEVFNDKIYVIGGLYNDTFNYVYDPATDSWTTKTPVPTAAVPSGVINGKVYFVGGYFDTNYHPINQIYNLETDDWSLGTPPPTFFVTGSAGVTSGKMAPERVYVFCVPYGDTAGLPNDPMYTNQVYDPEADNWTHGANIPTNRQDFGVAVVNDLFYIIGGMTMTYPDWGSAPVITFYATNEMYTPFEYGSILPSSPTANPGTFEPFPTIHVLTIVVAGLVLAGAGFLLYRKRGRGKTQ
jgi:N-acetylneuraminic acid mutarotase